MILLTHCAISVSLLQSLQKNGQISSMTSLNGHSEDNTLAEGVCVCVFTISIVYLHSVTVANVPVNSAASSGSVFVCVCVGVWDIALFLQQWQKVSLFVWGLFPLHVCVCVFTFLPADVFLALQDLLDP